MRMRARQHMAPVMKLKLKHVLGVIMGGMALTGGLTYAVFFFSATGFYQNTMAGTQRDSSGGYPFELSDGILKNVNFTVLTSINSSYKEVRPFISSNGKTLYFSRRNHPENVSKERDRQDIWVSTLESNNEWSIPKNIGVVINSKHADALCGVSSDGSEIVFMNDNIDPTKPLMKSKWSEKGWSEPEAIQIEDFYNNDPYIDFYYSFKANVLLMAVGRKDSKGGQDLYISFPKGKNSWSKPVSLGPTLNSEKSDFAPFLSADGRTLYFSSYGHSGLGGCDIFQTTRLDDTWENWSEPQNVGEGINSSREESYFSISGDLQHIYFESYDPKNEVRDIFRADLPAIAPGLLSKNPL